MSDQLVKSIDELKESVHLLNTAMRTAVVSLVGALGTVVWNMIQI